MKKGQLNYALSFNMFIEILMFLHKTHSIETEYVAQIGLYSFSYIVATTK